MAGDEEQLARDLAEQLKRLRVEDVLIQTLVTVSSLAFRSLGLTAETRESRDLGQARLAIETMRALMPVLGQALPEELVRDFNASVASLQLAYAEAAQEAGEGEAGEGEAGEGEDA
jgi:hypothetical protein